MDGRPKHCPLCGFGYTAGIEGQPSGSLIDETGASYHDSQMYSPCCGEPLADGVAEECANGRCIH